MDVIYEVRNLSYSYPGSQRQVLSGANLTLGRGEVLSILGPNGAGKSTLLNCMAGLLHPTAGDIELCGEVHSCHEAKGDCPAGSLRAAEPRSLLFLFGI